MTAYVWRRQSRGKVFGLKPLNGIGLILNWVIKDKKGFWTVDGQFQDGIVHGNFKTAAAARAEVEKRLGLERDDVCAHCGSPIVR